MLSVALALVSCGFTGYGQWGQHARYAGFDPDSVNPGGAADFTILVPLTGIFYNRINEN